MISLVDNAMDQENELMGAKYSSLQEMENIIQDDSLNLKSQTEFEKFQSDINLMKQMGLPVSFGASGDKRKEKREKNNNEELSKRQKKNDWKNKKERKRIEIFKRRSMMLFSKWPLIKERGVEIDEEMYYSITPEDYATKIANYCKERVDYTILIDGFCGVGGNLIQFAIQNKNAFIIGIDLCAERVENAQKIAQVYGVENQCDFICGDYLRVAASLHIKPDVIFLSPPWGGLNYKKKEAFLFKNLPVDGNEMFRVSNELTKNIALYLPRNQCRDDLEFLKEDYSLDFNNSFNFGTTLSVYFGELCDYDAEEILLPVTPCKLSKRNSSINTSKESGFIDDSRINEQLTIHFDDPNLSGEQDSNCKLIDNDYNIPITKSIDNLKFAIFEKLEHKRCGIM